jgi:uncharacterized protein (TIGR02145 family)
MKKILLLIALFMVSLTLNGVEPTVKFYFEDGNSNEYRIQDFIEMSIKESDAPYLMKIFNNGYIDTYNTNNINLLEIIDTYTLKVNLSNQVINYDIRTIDSITFVHNPYNQVKIGGNTWMGKNLDVEYYRNGDLIPQVTDSVEWQNLTTGAWCYYNNDPAMGAIYGKLYNGYAVTDARGLAPVGWVIPGDDYWMSLQYYVNQADNTGGGKLKTTGTVEKGDGLWANPNFGATNEFEFSAIPSGFRSEISAFTDKGKTAKFWSATEIVQGYLTSGGLGYDNAELKMRSASMNCGYSVRCVLASAPVIKPIIDSLSTIPVAIGDIITIYGSKFGVTQKNSIVFFNNIQPESSDYIGWSDKEIKVKVPVGTESGKISVKVDNQFSNTLFFTVSVPDTDVYTAVQIGDVGWMSKNLNVTFYRNGDPIPQVTDQTKWNNLKTGAWCYYNNDPSNGTVYGKLYNWYAVNDSRGLAPEGWHVPREEEWTVLMDFLGGSNEAGGKLKSTGTTKEPGGLWKAPNMGATNESGFTALPAGVREDYGFGGIETAAYWWSASEFDEDEAHSLFVVFMESSVIRPSNKKHYGYSVRCIKD